jgi:tripartite-type tricarboxylate transporter receptor subunit TctC
MQVITRKKSLTKIPFESRISVASMLPNHLDSDFEKTMRKNCVSRNSFYPQDVTERSKPFYLNVNDVIKELKSKPGSLNYGSSGLGSAHHLSAEVFMHLTNTKMQHVPYKGGPGVMADLIGGQLDLAFEVIPVASPFIKSGRLRALGVSSKTEIPALPGVKPIADIAVPGFQMETWQGAFAPAGTPPEITEKLGREIAMVIQMPQIQQKLQELGLIPDYRHNQEFKDFLQQDFAMWGKLVKDANIKAE